MADREVLLKSLDFIPVTTEGEKQGVEIYQYAFRHVPEMMPFYHLQSGFTADTTLTSDRFQKLGNKLALTMHLLANAADQPETIKAFAREHVGRHIIRKVSARRFRGFFVTFTDWLATRTTVDEATRKEWIKLGDIFSDEAERYSDELGLDVENTSAK